MTRQAAKSPTTAPTGGGAHGGPRLAVRNDDVVVCEDCYEPHELDLGRALFARIEHGDCSICGRTQ